MTRRLQRLELRADFRPQSRGAGRTRAPEALSSVKTEPGPAIPPPNAASGASAAALGAAATPARENAPHPPYGSPKTAAAAAREEIDTFAGRLLALSGGRTIPREWKQYLLRALAPKRSKAGRKLDRDRYIKIATELALLKDEERTERSKHNNPADHRRAIAKRHGVSEKTVGRIDRECRSLDDLARLDAPRRKARIEALAALIKKILDKEDGKKD